jgi:hypothetical protein
MITNTLQNTKVTIQKLYQMVATQLNVATERAGTLVFHGIWNYTSIKSVGLLINNNITIQLPFST